MFCDNALAFDPASGRADLAFDGSDLLIDVTAATPLIISVGCNRRARLDDELPAGETDFFNPNSLLSRQGWVGDALDPTGELIGSRLYLLDGAKDSEASRRIGESAAAECVDWMRRRLGLHPAIQVLRGTAATKYLGLQPGELGVVVSVANSEIEVRKALV